MKCESDCAIRREAGFAIASKDLDVDVLIESTGEPVTWTWEHAPTSTGGWRVRYC